MIDEIFTRMRHGLTTEENFINGRLARVSATPMTMKDVRRDKLDNINPRLRYKARRR